MIEPILRSRVVAIGEPLPPCWLRRAPTQHDNDEADGHILRVGPSKKLHQALIQSIDDAREVVLLSSFLLADEALAAALLRAAESGRRVYVLTASDEKLVKVVREDDVFESRMIEEHKRLLDSLAGRVLLRSAEHFHAKVLVTDPGAKPKGWISTANFNKALHESVELGVRLDARAARAVADWFAYAFWAEAERELAEKGRLAKVRPAPALPGVPTSHVVVATTRTHAKLRDAASRLIEAASKELIIATYGLDAEHTLVEAIAAKARLGVPVTVLTRPREKVRDAAMRLVQAGARVLGHDKLHAKAILSDGGGMIMSANLERDGLDTGFEIGILLDERTRDELRGILVDWSERFPWRFAAEARRSDHLGEICLADKSLRDGRREVVEEVRVPLSAVVAGDATRLDEAAEPTLRAPPPDHFPRRIRYEWQVVPPSLPKSAKERLQEVESEEVGKDGKRRKIKKRVSHDPPVYEQGGRVYVVARSAEDMGRARAAASALGGRVVVP